MKRLVHFAAALGCILYATSQSNHVLASEANWTSPKAMATQRVSGITSEQKAPVDMNDMDCYSQTYRITNTPGMKSGCFVPTAFGSFDPDAQVALFNGTDEGVSVVPSSVNQTLVPWPKALNLLTFDSAATGGIYVNMYKNPLASMQDQRDNIGRLIHKTLTEPPEQHMLDEQGRRLTINSQTLAFSDSGSWAVAETVYGVFVRINLASLKAEAFAKAFNRLGSSTPLDAEIAVSDNGRFVAIENAYGESFRVYDLQNCSSGSASSPCPSYEYWGFVKQQLGGQRTIKHIRFINDTLLSFDALPGSGFEGGTYELAPTESITALTDYIGLGDSYTSGEGAYNYATGTDTHHNSCHLSVSSYPMLIGRDLFSSTSAHSVACSGAVINDIANTQDAYRGQVKNAKTWGQLQQLPTTELDSIEANFTPGNIAQHRFVQKYQPRIITISIGGNDIGFGNILQNCVMPHFGGHASNNVCYNTYEDRLEVKQLIDRTVPRWKALYAQLRNESPGSQLYVIGYPKIMSDTGRCGFNVHLSQSELEFSQEVITYLNGVLSQSASESNIPFIDIGDALSGHKLCEASANSTAVNGLTAGNDVSIFGRESYHPNAFGHQLVEQSILRQTNNLTLKGKTATSETNTSQTLLNATATGRAVKVIEPGDYLENTIFKLGEESVLRIDGLDHGFLPHVTYMLHLDTAGGPILASALTDDNASFNITFQIPKDVEYGNHTLDIVGPNQTGATLEITEPIYISPESDITITISSMHAKASY